MAVGRKRKPDEAKVLQGTFRADRATPDAPVPSEEVASPPAWLSPAQRRHFLELVERLTPNQLASASYAAMLSLAAIQLGEVERCNAVITKHGATYKTTNSRGDAIIKSRPEVAQRQEASRHLQSLLAEFGLSAASRGKVSTGKGRRPANPFGALP